MITKNETNKGNARSNNMLTNKEIQEIEKVICYTFESKALLSQAFTRSSYAEEDRMHGGKGLSNEQLEFFGDSVLNYVLVSSLSFEHSIIDKDGNVHTRTQQELSNFVSFWSDKTMLSSRMTELGLNKYLLLGKGDIKQDVGNNKSAKEDLFEAIIGAMWFDSNQNLKLITNRIFKLLDLKFDEIYFKKNRFTELKEKIDKINAKGINKLKIEIIREENDFIFLISDKESLAFTKQINSKDIHLAQIMAADEAIKYLDENYAILASKKKIDPSTVTEANAKQKLTQLFQLHIISELPQEEEEFSYDTNLWSVKIIFIDGSKFIASDKNKQTAKNKAYLQAFKYAYKVAGEALDNGRVTKL